METIIVSLTGTLLAIIVPVLLKFEKRITRLEDKIDSLLNHNGIDPKGCIKDRGKRR